MASGNLGVYSSKDKMTAYVFVPKEREQSYPTVDEIVDVLRSCGVIYGIDIEKIKDMIADNIVDKRIAVAFGKPFERGIAGRIDILIDLSKVGRPELLEDGSVDHKKLHKLVNVRKGKELVRRIPPIPGKKGISVLNLEIEPPQPEDAFLKFGEGVEVSPDDENVLVASNDGLFFIDRDGHVEVRGTKVIQSDIDYSTGSVDFLGDLSIVGTVRSGFSVKTEGNLKISGSVEDANIYANGNIDISLGLNGSGKGTCSSTGSLKTHHVSKFSVNCDMDMVVKESILHSNIVCGGTLTAGKIVDGSLMVADSVVAESIGSASESNTELSVGSVFVLIDELQRFLKRREELTEKSACLKNDAYELVRIGMDSYGKLNEPHLLELHEIKDEIRKMNADIEVVSEKISSIEEKISAMPEPKVVVNKLYPGVTFRFGKEEKIIKTERSNVTVTYYDGNGIVIIANV